MDERFSLGLHCGTAKTLVNLNLTSSIVGDFESCGPQGGHPFYVLDTHNAIANSFVVEVVQNVRIIVGTQILVCMYEKKYF